MHETEFTIIPNLRYVICVKDIKKRFDIIRKKTDKLSTQTVSERNFRVDPTDDGRISYEEGTGVWEFHISCPTNVNFGYVFFPGTKMCTSW